MGIFSVKINDEFTVRGNDYLIKDPNAHLLIITGMNEHSRRYATFAQELNEQGFSVSVLDHFGQGENAPKEEDLEKWPADAWNMIVKALNVKVNELRKDNKPVYLMGHSMGSFAVQTYLEHYPNSVDKTIIMGSNGINNKVTIAVGCRIARLFATKKNWDKEARLMAKLSLGPYIKAVKNRKRNNDWLSYNEENVINYDADPYCGHFNTNGFFCEFMKGMNTIYQKKNLAKISKDEKILIVSGAEDPVGANGKGPKALKDMYTKLGLTDVTLILYPHMRHEILNELDRKTVVNDIVTFLKK